MHISAFGAALRTPDLRKKILFTLGLLALFRLGSVVPTPGIDYTAIQTCITQVQDNSVYALVNLFSGGDSCDCRSSRSASCRTSPRASSFSS